MTKVPPGLGKPYVALVPACDRNGNSLGGISLPEVQAPLGTYQGWNPRNKRFGNPDYMVRFEGSFWLFPGTEEERRASGDPRRSIEERYSARGKYVARLGEACNRLVRRKLLLKQACAEYLDLAGGMAWPPEPSGQYPYWKQE